jgi:hypothetical protein
MEEVRICLYVDGENLLKFDDAGRKRQWCHDVQ